MQSVLRMIRKGTFTVPRSVLAPDQCGPAEFNTFHYSVTLETKDATLLDSRSFLIDNLAVHQYFENRYREGQAQSHSCESMCIETAEFFDRLFNGPPTAREKCRRFLHPINVEDCNNEVSRIVVHMESQGPTEFEYILE